MLKKTYLLIIVFCLGTFVFPNQVSYYMDGPEMECCDSKQEDKSDSCCDSHHKKENTKHEDNDNDCGNQCTHNCHLHVVVPFSMIAPQEENLISQEMIFVDNNVSNYYLRFLPPNPLQDIWQPPKIS